MADESRIGTIWSGDELDVIVADYFDMLAAELAAQPYTKSHHCAAVMASTGRTHRSVEFKHQNISAVLDELGMPWIPGYKPKRNYQSAIFDAIDRYLTAHPDTLLHTPKSLMIPQKLNEVFVSPPTFKGEAADALPERLRQLVKKFDPTERDFRNRALGKAGEEFVVELEKQQLIGNDRPDLASNVRWVSVEDGDGAGYDVLSFHPSGRSRLIEVKTTNGSARTPFFLTRNECTLAKARPAEWCVYRVHFFARGPQIFTIAPPLESTVHLLPEVWRAYF